MEVEIFHFDQGGGDLRSRCAKHAALSPVVLLNHASQLSAIDLYHFGRLTIPAFCSRHRYATRPRKFGKCRRFGSVAGLNCPHLVDILARFVQLLELALHARHVCQLLLRPVSGPLGWIDQIGDVMLHLGGDDR